MNWRNKIFVSLLSVFVITSCGDTSSPSGVVHVSKSGSDTNAGTQFEPVLTIARGIAIAETSGEEIVFVGEGTFTEDIVISLPITLIGTGAGLSVIEGALTDGTANIDIKGTGATLRGFTIQMPSSGTPGGVQIGASYVQILDCIFKTLNGRVAISTDPTVFSYAGLYIHDNVFDILDSGDYGGIELGPQSDAVSVPIGVNLIGNIFIGAFYTAIKTELSYVNITNNIFAPTTSVMGSTVVDLQAAGGNINITGNTINMPSATVTTGFYVGPTSADITAVLIQSNTITSCDRGIAVAANSVTSGDILINQNSIYGNTTTALSFNGTGTLDATANWWGANVDPSGTGDITITGGGTVDSSNWLTVAP